MTHQLQCWRNGTSTRLVTLKAAAPPHRSRSSLHSSQTSCSRACSRATTLAAAPTPRAPAWQCTARQAEVRAGLPSRSGVSQIRITIRITISSHIRITICSHLLIFHTFCARCDAAALQLTIEHMHHHSACSHDLALHSQLHPVSPHLARLRAACAYPQAPTLSTSPRLSRALSSSSPSPSSSSCPSSSFPLASSPSASPSAASAPWQQ